MNEGGAVQRESRRFLLQPREATMRIHLDLTRNEVDFMNEKQQK